MTMLETVNLVPVVELAPSAFSTQRVSPVVSCSEAPSQWERFWLDSLSDAGITGLTPLRRGSWLVPTRELSDPATLERLLVCSWSMGRTASRCPIPRRRPRWTGGWRSCAAVRSSSSRAAAST